MEVEELTDSDIPLEILEGCKTPFPLFVRVLVFGILAAVFVVVTRGIQKYVGSSMTHLTHVLDVTWVVVVCVCLYLFGGKVWTFLETHLRNCYWYHTFKRYYHSEIMQRGMTKELAIRDAMEKIAWDKERQRLRNRNARIHHPRKTVAHGFSVSF